jgi:hypothetical protein
MRNVNVRDAIGKRLAHDLSRFIDGENERTPFRRGHRVTQEDVPQLLAMGKENVFVLEDTDKNNGTVHEEEASRRLAALCWNTGIGEAAVKITPLEIEDALLQKAEAIGAQTPLLEIVPYKLKTAGLVITGRIQDAFESLITEKLKAFGIGLTKIRITGDGVQTILGAITEIRASNPDLILCTGGMSVDPDDTTPEAIAQSGAKVISYGAPILPGSMMLLAYFDDGIPIMGVPGGALYKKDRGGILDIVLPRLRCG